MVADGLLSKAFLSSERVGKLRANAIVAAKEGDSLLQSSNEGRTNCVTQSNKLSKNCGFCSNRILPYFPMFFSQLVTAVTSQVFSII